MRDISTHTHTHTTHTTTIITHNDYHARTHARTQAGTPQPSPPPLPPVHVKEKKNKQKEGKFLCLLPFVRTCGKVALFVSFFLLFFFVKWLYVILYVSRFATEKFYMQWVRGGIPPKRSVPFRSIPFHSVPFRSIPFPHFTLTIPFFVFFASLSMSFSL